MRCSLAMRFPGLTMGGSATEAQRFAAKVVGRFMRERRPVSATCSDGQFGNLDQSWKRLGVLACVARQIQATVARRYLLAIITSGQSPNVLGALRTARDLDSRSIALTGRDGGEAGKLADVHVNVAEDSTARI